MASVFALRVLLGASLGLGALDLVWINASLAPDLVGGSGARAPAPAPPPASSPTPPPTPPPAPLPAPPPEVVAIEEPAVTVAPRLERVYFATGSAVLARGARRKLRELAQRASTGAELVLEGHADHRGGEAANLDLSRRRAIAVERYLRGLGVPSARVRVTFAGEEHASSERELWRDRRVDIQILGGP